MKQIEIKLTPSQNALQGLFGPNTMVMVLCDATDGPFNVEMADAQSSDNNTFRFVKIDSTANKITITAKSNQKIMNEDTQELSQQADELVLNVGEGNWW